MSIELISIGSELLSGHTINTNATVIAEALLKEGWTVSRVTTISDEKTLLQNTVNEVLGRADYVIVTGGLGPTHDDITRTVLAEIFDSPLHLDHAIADDLEKRYGTDLASLTDQATVPTKAKIIPNHLGTAPGFIFEDRLISLPGVPSQMEAMLHETVVPFFHVHMRERRYTESLYLCLTNENDIELPDHPDVTIGICPSYGTLSIHLSSLKKGALEEVGHALKSRYGPFLYSTTDSRIELALHNVMVEKKLTLSCAESCTGGAIASLLTQIPGASDYFLGSIVSYANQVKQTTLGVGEKILADHGAVSRETVTEMAEGLFTTIGSDYVIAVSGIAGPTGGSDEKPVGTVWAAVGKQGALDVATFVAKGISRERIIRTTAVTLIGQLWQQLTS